MAPNRASSRVTRSGHRGLGDYPSNPPIKHSYYPGTDAHLAENHPCAPSSPIPIFTPSNAELWSQCRPPIPDEDHDLFSAWEHPPQQQKQKQRPAPSPSHAVHGTSHSDLSRLSTRPYAIRASDSSDFASAWESLIVPLLTDLLQKHCTCDFAVDVHNFPEVSSEAVPRVIYITLSAGVDTTGLEQTIRSELGIALPERFNPVYLKFRQGGLRKSGWWGRQPGEEDLVCEPKNVTYRPSPVIGMSIGPVRGQVAASLGGFVKVGSDVYAMSARHTFEDAIKVFQFQVAHPATPDVPLLVPSDPEARPYSIGSVVICAQPGTLRPSLTFRGTNFQHTKVEMDWCLIGPVPKGKNILSVPSFRADGYVAVESTAAVEGNTEVFAIARTSGYSLGFTSDVPGVQRICGQLRREWTVRQYSASKHPKDGRKNAPWQTLKQWVTSGIGVPGDSGAWLIRRSDNALVGLIWARNHNCGDPSERVRLTYFTPMVDIFADIQQGQGEETEVSLPVYSAGETARGVRVRGPQEAVDVDISLDPWNIYSREAIRGHHQVQEGLIQSHFAHGSVPSSGAVLNRRPGIEESLSLGRASTRGSIQAGLMESSIVTADPPTPPPQSDCDCGSSISTLKSRDKLLLGLELKSAPDLPVPELSASSSIRSGSSMADENSEVASTGNGVRIAGELDMEEEVTEMEEPIRAKASFAPRYPGLLRLDQVPVF